MRRTFMMNSDRYGLIDLLRSIVDEAPDKCSMTQLTQDAMQLLQSEVKGDPSLRAWFDRAAQGALADRIYTEIGLLMKAKRMDISLPFMRNPIAIAPRQGVRVKGAQSYQQSLFLAFGWDEYESWRADWLARFEHASGMRALISFIDKARLLYPDATDVGMVMRLGGAKIALVVEEGAA